MEKKRFTINKGTAQETGLYNITPNDKNDKRLSHWFNHATYKHLIALTPNKFNKACELLLNDPYEGPLPDDDCFGYMG